MSWTAAYSAVRPGLPYGAAYDAGTLFRGTQFVVPLDDSSTDGEDPAYHFAVMAPVADLAPDSLLHLYYDADAARAADDGTLRPRTYAMATALADHGA